MTNFAKRAASILPIAFFVVNGCSSGDPTTQLSQIDQFALDQAEIKCSNNAECYFAETDAECLASTRYGIERRKAWVENGTVVFHPEKIEACLAASKAYNSCSYTLASQPDVTLAVIEACDREVFTGAVEDGGACFSFFQCKSGSCEKPSCSESCCEGICVASMTLPPPAKIGESCADVVCEAGAYCAFDVNAQTQTCAPQLDLGQPCTGDYSCKAPGICDWNHVTDTYSCRVPAARGEMCDPNYLYACELAGDICDPNMKTCGRRGLVGEACVNDWECVPYAYCTIENKCVKRPLKGEDCIGRETYCLGDLECIDGKCDFVVPVVCK